MRGALATTISSSLVTTVKTASGLKSAMHILLAHNIAVRSIDIFAPRCLNTDPYPSWRPIMGNPSMLTIIGGAALLTAAPFSLQWSQKNVALSL